MYESVKLVCVVIPVYKNFNKLSSDELVSWDQCLKVLYVHTICLIYPNTLNVADYEEEFKAKEVKYQLQSFEARYFAGVDGYNQLMLSKSFFEKFTAYDYMLTYQLDAYVFKDELAYWCATGYSYVGAPWFEGFGAAHNDSPLWKVGNGGFSLRNIAHSLQVLNTYSSIWTPPKVVKWYFRHGRLQGLKNSPKIIKTLLLGNNTHSSFNDFHLLREKYQEDYFWGIVCSEKFDWYKVPVAEQALRFSFEVLPRRLYKLNGNQLPMGCHAWDKYDTDFWRQFIPASS